MEISADYGLTEMPGVSAEKISHENVSPENKPAQENSAAIQMGITPTTVRQAMIAALESLGFKPTEENRKLAALLLEAQLPVNKENLVKLNQAMKLTGGDDAKAMFLIENRMRPNLKNAAILTQLIQGEAGLGEEIKNLLQDVEQISDPAIKKILSGIFSEGQKAEANQGAPEQGKQVEAGHEEPLPRDVNVRLNPDEQGEPPARQNSIQDETDTTLKDIAAKDIANEDIQAKNVSEKDIPAGDISAKDTVVKDIPVKDILAKDMQTKDTSAKEAPTKEIPINDIHFKDTPLIDAEENIFKESSKLSQAGKLFFNPRGKDPKEIDEYINTLKEKLTQAREQLAKQDSTEAAKALKQIINIEERIEFISQMQNDVFIQLPLSIHNHETNGELFVFKDKKNKAGRQGAASALIALETVTLGRFEVYVRKDGRKVNCQFRLAGRSVEKLVREHMDQLAGLLSQHNYSLEMFSFKKLEEPFTLLNKEPLPEESGSGLRKENTAAKISFDIKT